MTIRIVNCLVLSTAHLMKDTVDVMVMHANTNIYEWPDWRALLAYDETAYGFCVYVPDQADDPDCDKGLLSDLAGCFALARKHKLTRIFFDRDEDVIDELRSWEW